ncbi:MAG TPA: hypothetical protein VM008_07740 [Phycisphaerae bacterium]|nr:hypothetical protein [Phycisphaerae bacterium]
MKTTVRFRRLLLAAAILPGLSALAQNPEPDKPQITKITISPTPIEKPALACFLLPEPQDTQPGNAAIKYEMAADLYLSYRLNGNTDPKEDETLDKLNTLPLAELNLDAARKILDPMRMPFNLLREGARRESCNWELNLRQEGFATLLPYLSPIRAQARRLQLAIRVDIKNHHWNLAHDKLQTGYAIARHLAHGQTLIETLVAAAIAGQMNACLKDWISEPGSPNLFWPLADLPQPIAPLNPGISFERALIYFDLPEWKNMMKGEGTPEQLAGFLQHFLRLANATTAGFADHEGDIFHNPQLMATGLAIIEYPQAKEFLIQRGAKPEEVEKRPVASVVGEFISRDFRETSDEVFKWMFLPPNQAIPGLLDTEKDLAAIPSNSMPNILARTLLPALSRAIVNTARPDRQLAALRIVEALRDYAAQHHALPDSLNQLALPLSNDPTLGKPFSYEHHADTAVLTSPAPPGGSVARDELHYEITLQPQ